MGGIHGVGLQSGFQNGSVGRNNLSVFVHSITFNNVNFRCVVVKCLYSSIYPFDV